MEIIGAATSSLHPLINAGVFIIVVVGIIMFILACAWAAKFLNL